MPGLRWSDAEHESLRCAVGVHGCNWARIAAANLVPGRSARALRHEYKRMLITRPVVVTAPKSTVTMDSAASLLWPRPTQSRYALRAWPYYLRKHTRKRAPTSSQLLLIQQLQLHDAGAHPLLVCDLKRARERS